MVETLYPLPKVGTPSLLSSVSKQIFEDVSEDPNTKRQLLLVRKSRRVRRKKEEHLNGDDDRHCSSFFIFNCYRFMIYCSLKCEKVELLDD